MTLASVFFRFCLATACGAAIGVERSKKRHAAGLRTHIVVCIGAASVMILSQYLSANFNSNADPARLGAQVISGIGFLGAGTIMTTGYESGLRIKGLTTAAGLWASACMGLVIGSGYYEAAVIMCVFLFTVIVSLNRVDEKYLRDSTVLRFYIEYADDMPFSVILGSIRKNYWHLAHIEYINEGKNPVTGIIIDVQRTRSYEFERLDLLNMLRGLDGVLFVESV